MELPIVLKVEEIEWNYIQTKVAEASNLADHRFWIYRDTMYREDLGVLSEYSGLLYSDNRSGTRKDIFGELRASPGFPYIVLIELDDGKRKHMLIRDVQECGKADASEFHFPRLTGDIVYALECSMASPEELSYIAEADAIKPDLGSIEPVGVLRPSSMQPKKAVAIPTPADVGVDERDEEKKNALGIALETAENLGGKVIHFLVQPGIASCSPRDAPITENLSDKIEEVSCGDCLNLYEEPGEEPEKPAGVPKEEWPDGRKYSPHVVHLIHLAKDKRESTMCDMEIKISEGMKITGVTEEVTCGPCQDNLDSYLEGIADAKAKKAGAEASKKSKPISKMNKKDLCIAINNAGSPVAPEWNVKDMRKHLKELLSGEKEKSSKPPKRTSPKPSPKKPPAKPKSQASKNDAGRNSDIQKDTAIKKTKAAPKKETKPKPKKSPAGKKGKQTMPNGRKK